MGMLEAIMQQNTSDAQADTASVFPQNGPIQEVDKNTDTGVVSGPVKMARAAEEDYSPDGPNANELSTVDVVSDVKTNPVDIEHYNQKKEDFNQGGRFNEYGSGDAAFDAAYYMEYVVQDKTTYPSDVDDIIDTLQTDPFFKNMVDQVAPTINIPSEFTTVADSELPGPDGFGGDPVLAAEIFGDDYNVATSTAVSVVNQSMENSAKIEDFLSVAIASGNLTPKQKAAAAIGILMATTPPKAVVIGLKFPGLLNGKVDVLVADLISTSSSPGEIGSHTLFVSANKTPPPGQTAPSIVATGNYDENSDDATFVVGVSLTNTSPLGVLINTIPGAKDNQAIQKFAQSAYGQNVIQFSNARANVETGDISINAGLVIAIPTTIPTGATGATAANVYSTIAKDLTFQVGQQITPDQVEALVDDTVSQAVDAYMAPIDDAADFIGVAAEALVTIISRRGGGQSQQGKVELRKEITKKIAHFSKDQIEATIKNEVTKDVVERMTTGQGVVVLGGAAWQPSADIVGDVANKALDLPSTDNSIANDIRALADGEESGWGDYYKNAAEGTLIIGDAVGNAIGEVISDWSLGPSIEEEAAEFEEQNEALEPIGNVTTTSDGEAPTVNLFMDDVDTSVVADSPVFDPIQDALNSGQI